jgi:hypothetical protein
VKTIEIIPFHSIGEFKFNEKRSVINSKIDLGLIDSREETIKNNNYIIDNFKEALVYYNKNNERLFFVSFTPEIDLVFNKKSLFSLNSGQLFEYFSGLDNSLFVENYVGFTSLKYGIDIYADSFTDDKTSEIIGISIAIKGYFDAICNNTILDINSLQRDIKE